MAGDDSKDAWRAAEKAEREKRLAEALRSNLRRRKAAPKPKPAAGEPEQDPTGDEDRQDGG